MLRKILFSLFIIFSLTNLSQAQRNVLEKLIKQNQNEFGPWVKDPAQFEVQIIYTQIDRDAQNRPQFTSHSYGLDPTRYFYPASTVKMPAAFVALEKLNELGIVGLDKYTPLKIGASREPQTAVVVDTATASNLPSVADYVRKIFLVSDNDAFNRLYEFLGQAYFNEQLREKGYRQSRIIHRLSISGFDSIDNRHTNPISFYEVDKLHYYQGPVYSKFYDDLGLRQQIRGKAYMDSKGEIIQ